MSTSTRVLLVEDHADTRAVLSRLLTRVGFEVVEAADALFGKPVDIQKLLEWLTKNPSP
jgi:CheY-like chemotaxis protein